MLLTLSISLCILLYVLSSCYALKKISNTLTALCLTLSVEGEEHRETDRYSTKNMCSLPRLGRLIALQSTSEYIRNVFEMDFV